MKILIEGMTCAHCAAAVEKAIYAVDGVEKVKVNLKKKTASVKVKHDIDEKSLNEAVENAGYRIGKIL